MRSQCIITGCKLLLVNEGAACHGDLFILANDVFIFNSNVASDGHSALRTQVVVDDMMQSKTKAIMVSSNNCFEKRGTFVFHRTSSHLNEAALDYIGPGVLG